MLRKHLTRVAVVAALLGTTTTAIADDPLKAVNHAGPAKTATNDVYRPMVINNVFNYYANNGDGSFNKYRSDQEGFEWPRGYTAATLVFEDGVFWGCKQSGILKVGGSAYRHGLQAGPILVYGTVSTAPIADDPSTLANRIYCVRPDIKPIPGVTDPNDPLAAGEMAILADDEIPLIGRYQPVSAAQLLAQYWSDWLNWPAVQGAPFTDVDHNGSYDPTIDLPGIPAAGQTLWYLANDLDAARTIYFAGSSPIGLEMQKTIWAYNISGVFSNTIYARTRLINKSGVQLDSMYVAQWSDPDLGDAFDDFVGCDTVLNLGFAYNSRGTDGNLFGLVPPAVGFDLLQGPMVAGVPTDTAIFKDAYRPGFRNLPMTAFVFSAPNATYSDAMQGPGGDIQWYRFLKGTIANSGASYINPVTGLPTVFPLSGDPAVGGSGWLDGNPVPPSDRRMATSSGPFSMAPGDTQEVVVACIVSRGADYLSSVSALKADVRVVQRVYHSLNQLLPPRVSYAVTKSATDATISFRAEALKVNASAVKINLKTYADAIVGTVTLVDDGLHDDGAAGDGVFGGSVQIPQQQSGLEAEALVTYVSGEIIPWAHTIDDITTTRVTVSSYSVASDNINNDGVPNPGENVRYVLSLTNYSSKVFSDLTIRPFSGSVQEELSLKALDANATYSYTYNPNDPTTYLDFVVPGGLRDSSLSIPIVITDVSHNRWRDTLVFPVQPSRYKPTYSPLTHVLGDASGTFTLLIVDSTLVKNHIYILRGVDSAGTPRGYSLKDSTTGIVLLQSHPLPDGLGHTSPVIDGFKVLIGTIDTLPGMKSWSIPSGVRRFSPVGGGFFGLEGFSAAGDPGAPQDRNLGTIGMGQNFQFGGIGTSVAGAGYHDVLLTWAAVPALPGLWDPKAVPTDSNYSRAYRYVCFAASPPAKPEFAPWITNPLGNSGYAYQGYDYGVPFSVWDQSTTPPTRLAVGHLENNQPNGLVDGRYFPGLTTVDNGAADGPREFAFIFATPYTTTPDPQYMINVQNSKTPLMWVMTCSRRTDPPYSSADQFRIVANHLPNSQDVWTFNPYLLTDVKEEGIPSSFALLQNFPNPFNPSTTIRYELPVPGMVSMKIYNVLGQEVRTLVNEVQNAGPHVRIWNSTNDAGRRVASGVYFYRCTTLPSNRDNPFSRTMKMILVR